MTTNSTFQLKDMLASISSRRTQQFDDEKEEVLEAFLNTPHFKQFKMKSQLKKKLEKCMGEIGYQLHGPNKILHQYGKSGDNIFFIIQGQANVYAYKQDSELELECFYTAQRSLLLDHINKLKNPHHPKNNLIEQKKNSIENLDNSLNLIENMSEDQIPLTSAELQLKVKILEDELKGIEEILGQRFNFFDNQNEVIISNKQFFIDGVCMLKFIKQLKESDSFSVMENNRDQIIVSATEIHLTNIPTQKYLRCLVPLKARNEYFTFFLNKQQLQLFINPFDISETAYLNTQIIYDAYSNNSTENYCSDNIYLVKSGIFSIQLPTNKQSTTFLTLRQLKQGDIFGIEDILNSQRNYRVKCESDQGVLLHCKMHNIFKLSKKNKTILAEINTDDINQEDEQRSSVLKNSSTSLLENNEDNDSLESEWLVQHQYVQELKEVYNNFYTQLSQLDIDDIKKRNKLSITEQIQNQVSQLIFKIQQPNVIHQQLFPTPNQEAKASTENKNNLQSATNGYSIKLNEDTLNNEMQRQTQISLTKKMEIPESPHNNNSNKNNQENNNSNIPLSSLNNQNKLPTNVSAVMSSSKDSKDLLNQLNNAQASPMQSSQKFQSKKENIKKSPLKERVEIDPSKKMKTEGDYLLPQNNGKQKVSEISPLKSERISNNSNNDINISNNNNNNNINHHHQGSLRKSIIKISQNQTLVKKNSFKQDNIFSDQNGSKSQFLNKPYFPQPEETLSTNLSEPPNLILNQTNQVFNNQMVQSNQLEKQKFISPSSKRGSNRQSFNGTLHHTINCNNPNQLYFKQDEVISTSNNSLFPNQYQLNPQRQSISFNGSNLTPQKINSTSIKTLESLHNKQLASTSMDIGFQNKSNSTPKLAPISRASQVGFKLPIANKNQVLVNPYKK